MLRYILGVLILCLVACQPVAEANQAAAATANPIFIRIIKTTAERDKGVLEIWEQDENGRFALGQTFDICTWSGALGPKLREGDGQSPEGFYFIKPSSLNPNSTYHLSFNLGFPNSYDRAHDRTGSFLMVHGDCVSIGCYAMTDEGIEEIYADVEAAFAGGQAFIRVHIFPFEMTEANIADYAGNPNIAFWRNLKTGWDWFERERVPPNVTVSNKSYQFEAAE